MDVKSEWKSRKDELTRKRNENALLERQARTAEDDMLTAAQNMQVASEGLEFVEWVASSRRGSMKGRIESVLTEALQLVYGDKRRMELTYSVKNNRSHLDFELVKQTPAGEVRRVLDGTGSGLGVSDTASVPLRLLVLLGSKQADKVSMLDECYKHMNLERVPIVTQFLRVLTERLGIQVIILSHHEMMRSDVDAAFKVTQGADFVSKVCRV